MDELQKLYDVLVREGKYTKSFEEFQTKWGQDQAYKDKVYDVVSRDGLYTKDKNSFFQKYSVAESTPKIEQPITQPVEEPINVKKNNLPIGGEDLQDGFDFSQPTSEAPSVLTPQAQEKYIAEQEQKPVKIPVETAPKRAQTYQAPKELTEEDYFTGSFGNVLRGFDKIVPIGLGDFIDDMSRSVAAGYRQGSVAEEADRLLLQGAKASPEQIQKFINANKNSQAIGSSAEMQDYQKIYEGEGKGFWGVVKGLANNPSIIPEVLTSSIIAMATNTDALTAGAAAIGTGAGIGAAAGAPAGGVGAIPGAVAGSIASVPYAFGLASSVVEMGSTFGELLQEELGEKEMTKDNVKAILENPDKLNDIRNKAIARGAIIGTVDAFTGKLASGVGAKILSRSAAKSATGAATKGAVTKATAAGAAIEGVGGSAGEATARGAIGQEMDVSEIALEGIAELPGGIRSTIQARLAKPSYKVNGEKVSAEQIDELTSTMTPAQLQQTKIDIKNDYEGREFKIQDKIVTNSIKEQVRQGNPELNETSLNAITQLEKDLKGLEGNITQTGKDKAAAIRGQIKNIQENQLQEEEVAETVIAEAPKEAEISKPEVAALKDVESTAKALKDINSKDNKALDKVFESISPLGLKLEYNKDLILSKENEFDFGYDLQKYFGIRDNGYRKIGDAVIRIKDHTPNYNNFVEDVENGAKKIINVVYGDYNNTDRRKLKTDIDNFEQKYPNIEIIDVKIETGDNLEDAIDIIKKDVLSEIAKEYQKGSDKKLVKSVENLLKTQTDAIQIETAGQVPVLTEARVGEEVVQGEPQAEPKVVTEEGVKAEEVGSGVEGDVEFGTAFNMQDATAENTVGKEKDLWGKAQVWRERIENAGDILRELSSRGDKPDVRYLMEKVTKLRDWIAKSKDGYTPIDKDIKTIEEFEKTNLRFTDAVDSREYIEKFHSNILDRIRSEYEAIPSYTKEQRLAVELVLDLINNNIKGLESKLNEIENISSQIKANGTLPIIADIKLGKAVEQTPAQEVGKAEDVKPTRTVEEIEKDQRGLMAKYNDALKEAGIYELAMKNEADPAEIKKIRDRFKKDADKLKAEKESLTPEVEKGKEGVDAEAEKLLALLGAPKGEPKFRLSEGTEEPLTTDIEAIEKEMNDMPQVELDFVEPDVSQKGLKVNPVAESNSIVKIAKKIGNALLKPIQYFNGIPMITGMSDMLAAGKIKDSEGNYIDVDGGLLFNVLGKNKGAAWAGVTKEGAQAQYDNAVKLYKSNKELFDRLWSEGKLPDGHIPMAIMRMADTAVNSNEAVFRWVLPTIEKFSKQNKVNAMKAFIESTKEKLNTKTEGTVESAKRILSFIEEKKIKSLDEFFKEIILDANNRAKGGTESLLALPSRSLIFDLIFAPKGIKKASKPTVKALLEGTDNSKNKRFTSDVIYNAIGEPSMLKSKQGEVVSIVGIDVKNGGVIPVEHGNYGFGTKGKTIALIENPTHGIDVFPEWRAKASRVFKITKPKDTTKEGTIPSLETVASQTGGPFFTDKAFRGAKVLVGLIDDLNLLIGKLRFSFPSVTVSTTQKEFDNIINSPEVRTHVSDGKVILGVTKDGKIYLNPEMSSLQTPIHEFGHIWIDFLRSDASGQKGTDLLNKGLSLVKNTNAHKKAITKYGNTDIALEEALVELMANKGATIINAAKRSQFKSWMNATFKYIQEKFTTFKDLDINKIAKIKLDDFINTGLADLFSGKEVSAEFIPEQSESAFKARMSAVEDINEIIKIGRANNISEEAITKVLKDKDFNEQEIMSAFVAIKAEEADRFAQEQLNSVMKKVDAFIARQKGRGIEDSKITSNIDTYLRKQDEYLNANDAQKKIIEREARAKMGAAPKRAVSIGRVLGALKDITNISREEKLKIITQIRKLSKDAAKDLVKEIREMESSGKITLNQAANIIAKTLNINPLNEASVSNFVDYMAKVFANAEYVGKMTTALAQIKNAKTNIKTKIGVAQDLFEPLNQLLSINPTLIPLNQLEKYLGILKDFSARKAVLSIDDRVKVLKQVNEILDEINNELSAVDVLADRFNNYNEQVFKDGSLDYAATIKKMIDNGLISTDEADLMKKYKSEILPQVEATPLTEEEIAEQKKEQIKILKSLKIDNKEFPLPSRDEKEDALNLAKLIKELSVEDLMNISLTDLKNIIKVIDNINNGYLPHYAKISIEKLNAIKEGKVLSNAIEKAKPLSFSKLYSRLKNKFTRKGVIDELIRATPLYYIGNVFGDFKTRDIFNSLFEKSAQALSIFNSELKRIEQKIETAQNKVLASFNQNSENYLMSKFRMTAYMLQREYESNIGKKGVKYTVSQYLEETIKHIGTNKSIFKEADAEKLQKILKEVESYIVDGKIDLDKFYKTFNSAEKNAINVMTEINKSLGEIAAYTAAVIRGDKVELMDNYFHHNVLHEQNPMDATSAPEFSSSYSNSMRPSTKAKSLIERTDKLTPLNFDLFTSTYKGAKFVLLDYNLTSPIRTAKRTLIQAKKNLEKKGLMDKKNVQIYNAIDNAYEEALQNVLTNAIVQDALSNATIDFIKKQGYRAVLAGTTRFQAELLSNIANALLINPSGFIEGIKHAKLIASANGYQFMKNAKSKQLFRLYASDALSGKMVDPQILKQTSGIKGSVSKGALQNRTLQIYNLTAKKYVQNPVEYIADTMLTTPDKVISMPLWFGSFINEFKKITGEEVNQDMMINNDLDYMQKYADAIEQSTRKADQESVYSGASNNEFMGILKGKIKPNQGLTEKVWNNFNSFMTNFMNFDYAAARSAVYNLFNEGYMTKKKAAAVLAGLVTRSVIYQVMVANMGAGVVGAALGLAFDWEDEEEVDEKSFFQKLERGLANVLVGYTVGRNFGNAVRGMINFGVEQINEEYLDFLRNGKYDFYKDNIAYSYLNFNERGDIDIPKVALNMAGAYTPALSTAVLIGKNFGAITSRVMGEGSTKKEPEAIRREDMTVNYKIPLEVAGNLGLIPIYKDVKRAVNDEIYKDLRKAANTSSSSIISTEVNQKVEALEKIKTNTKNKNVYNAIDEKINELQAGAEEKKNIKEENAEEKQRKEELLTNPVTGKKYDNESELKRYNKRLYNKNFGVRSEWYKEHRYEELVQKKMNLQIRKMEDRENRYRAPIKKTAKKRNSDGSFKRVSSR
jgi:hypothetical protein